MPFSFDTAHMENCRLFWINLRHAEIVRPYVCLPLRVRSLTFDRDQEKGKAMCEYKELSSENLRLFLPRPVFIVKRSSCDGCANVSGITHAIKRKFYEKGTFCPRRMKASEAQRVGVKIDKEMKDFAKGKMAWDQITRKETKAIIEHLFLNNISLVTSRVFVTNFDGTRTRKKYSVTEIDVVGFDHESRQYVVIELKCTGKYFHSLLSQNRKATIDKDCGFKRSEIGQHAAQLACSTLMFHQTYPTVHCYPLLVLCELGASRCHSVHSVKVKECFLKRERFSRWINGF